MREMAKIARKIKNNIFAIPAAAPAMPAKPKTAAISAITRKVTAQPNIALLLLLFFRCSAAEAAPHRHALRISQRYDLPIKLHVTCHEHRLPINLDPSPGDLDAGVLLHVEILAFQVPRWPNLYTCTLPIIC